MLSQSDNELVSRVGPGTPMGALFREYWLPAGLSSELPHADCDPVRVKLLGEELIAFRDTEGNVGLIANLCPHRGASLFFGRNEESGLRCVYHGWKFDTTGQCVDMPNEPPESNFKSKIKATAYPTREAGGMIWAYMGPRETPPPMPEFEPFDATEWDIGAATRNCNWLQGLEGDLDTSHTGFLHSGARKLEDTEPGTIAYFATLEKAPRFTAMDTDYGAIYGAFRPGGPGLTHWRVSQFLFPCYAHINGSRLRAWVPMDDHHLMFYELDRVPADPAKRYGGGNYINDHGSTLIPNSTDWFGRFRLAAALDNDYLIDRDAQRRWESFTGIGGTFAQDHAVTETMGPVLDRTVEHLGTADTMVVWIRRRLIDAAAALVDHKTTPPGVDEPSLYRTRAAGNLLMPDTASLGDTAQTLEETPLPAR